MASTPQSQAIVDANTVMSLSAQMVSLYNAITNLNASWNDHGSLAVLQAMGTVAANADGTLGAADATPNNAHPLDPSKYPSINRAVSANTISNVLFQLNNICNYINGNALTATPGVRSVLNSVNGG